MGLIAGIFWILLITNIDKIFAQTRKSSRIISSRSFGLNTKSSSLSGVDFDCPEEFGYYPHPTDCTQYYVCVFGGALLESCTGGLMYSHELQTCDWPRNVGCEVSEINSSPPSSLKEISSRVPQTKQQKQQHVQVSQRVRFSALSSESSQQHQSQTQPPRQQQQQQNRQQQIIQAQIQAIPPPPALRIAPNPVITSRGQPKPISLDSREEIAKLYAEAHDTLPPIEEEETDRQQRVYRGQPSTVSQVQRDRDGIIHQANINAIPNHGKVGSYAFGSQVNQFRVETSSQPGNVFVQQRPSKTATEQNTRNYHNNTNHQQQFRSSPYDSYYSVYDDDVELYRDVEFSSEHQQQRGKSQSSTYRPELVSTQAPLMPGRDTYNKPQTNQQQHEQPSLVYNTDYDDTIISQLEDDDYNQPTRNPLRDDRIEINSIMNRPVLISRTTDESPYTPTHTLSPISYAQIPQSPKSQSPPIQQQKQQQQQQSRQPQRTSQQSKYIQSYPIDQYNVVSTSTPDYPTKQTTPSRQSNRHRGGAHYSSSDRDQPATVPVNRGTHPPRIRPTLKPSGTIVSKATEFIDIYRNPALRAEPLYPQPTPDKTAAKCRKDVCLLPDCYCGGKDIPGDLPVENVPQIVLLTFDDSVNDLNKQLYIDLFEKGRVNPNGCPITATFYVSHEWTDYSQVQNLYADGHEMASHTVSHSFGEQFSQKKWTREVAGQREILAAYGGVKLSDVRGMRAPFLSIGGNKMFKMLYDSNFTYDSSMPVYENRPPSWPYTLDYKIFHDCMIPPCPTKSYPGVWEVPMVMWQDLNGGRCSMGDACSNPADAENVYKMIMKNFERHYTTNRAPFGLFYHAAWFTQPHHKEGFISFLDTINTMNDVWIVTNWQALQWVRDPTPLSRINHFQPFQCDYSDRPKRCNNPKVCNLWHKSGVRYMRTCQPCPDIYPWTGKTGIRSSRIDNDIEE